MTPARRAELKGLAEKAEIVCPHCGGNGWYAGTGCCGQPNRDGSCCGQPIQIQEQCGACNGNGFGDWQEILNFIAASRTALPECLKEIERLERANEAERQERGKLHAMLRGKDEAMGVLFERLRKAGVDVSDLIP